MTVPRRCRGFLVALLVLGACTSDDDATTSPPTSSAPGTTTDSTTTAPATTTPATTTPATTTPATTTPATTAPSTTAPPTTAPVTAPTTAPGADPELQALAATALLDLSAFPEGWVETPAEPDQPESAEDETFATQVDECLGVADTTESDLLEAREASSNDFAFTDDTTELGVEHRVTVADDEQMAIRSMERAGTDGAADCLQDALQASFDADPDFSGPDSDVRIGDVVVTRLDGGPDPLVRVGYRIEIPISLGVPLGTDGQEFVSQFLDVVYQRDGRALSQLQLASLVAPFPDAGVAALTDEVGARLATIRG